MAKTGNTVKLATGGLAKIWKEYEDYLELGSDVVERTHFPTGVIALNQAIGDIDGITGGSIIQIIGESGRGKSTLSLDFLAQAQKKEINEVELPNGKVINAVYADFERTFDADYAATIGVDVAKVLVIKTPFAEDTFNIIEELLNAGIQFVIVDSIPMIVPKSEEEKDYNDNEKMASAAGVLGRFIKRSVQLVDSADAVMLLINQYRSNISPMAHTDKKPYGARIIQYAIKVSISLERVKREDKRMHIQAFVEKTKLGATGKKIEFQIVHGEGIDYNQHLLSLAVDYAIVGKSGAWYYYHPDGNATKEHNTHRAQGEGNADKLPLEEIKGKVMEAMYREEA